jgi:UDP-N-acetylmuramoyl-tripeptide--D-alanyl-D-alanine ligase
MESRSLRFFAEATQGELVGVQSQALVSRVCTDSRDLRPGDLFVALSGDRHDGHQFVPEAIRRGAVAAMVNRSDARRFEGLPLLVVGGTRSALGRMAARYREGFRLPLIAVAGSNGKTTTKEILGTILAGCFETLRSPESFNNDIGVPRTLFDLESRHVAGVVEVGTNHPGELAPLLRMVQPRIGVLTHVGEEHLEHFGSLAGVLEEEGWIGEFLPPDGVLVLPGDAPWSDAIAARTRARLVRVGSGPRVDWRLLGAETDAEGTTFGIRAPRSGLSGEYRINLLGRHQVVNAMLALAVASEFGLSREEMQRGLAACRPARWRMNRWQYEGVEVIEDCYNANLDSMLAALEALRAFPCLGRRVVLVGGMAELGIHTARAHAVVGRRAAELGIDRLIGVGEAAAVSVEAAVEAGMGQALSVDTLETAVGALRAFLRPGDCLLVKGSRSARLERLGAMIRAETCLQHAA